MFVQSQHYVEVTSEVASSGVDEGIVHIKHASPHSSAVSTKSKYTGDESLEWWSAYPQEPKDVNTDLPNIVNGTVSNAE